MTYLLNQWEKKKALRALEDVSRPALGVKCFRNHCRICIINGQVEVDPVSPRCEKSGNNLLIKWWRPRKDHKHNIRMSVVMSLTLNK